MTDPIRQISTAPLLPSIRPAGDPQATAAKPGAFESIFRQAVNQVEAFQQDSQTKINRFLNGENEDVHQVVLATQRAQLSFDLFMQVRNKVVSAYQEAMRMQM